MVRIIDFIINNLMLFHYTTIIIIFIVLSILYLIKNGEKDKREFLGYGSVTFMIIFLSSVWIILNKTWLIEESKISKRRVICSYTEEYAYEKSMILYKDIVLKYFRTYSANAFDLVSRIDNLDFLDHEGKISLMEYILSNDIHNVRGTHPSTELDNLIDDVKKNSIKYQEQKRISEEKEN